MRFLPLLAVLAAMAGAQAQAPVVDGQRFARLEVGNRWEYTLTNHIPATPVATGRSVATVDREVVIEGERYVVLTQQDVALDGTPSGPRYSCAYSPALDRPASEASAGLPDYSCSRQRAYPPHPQFWAGPATVTPRTSVSVSGQTVDVDSLLTLGQQHQGSGGAYTAFVDVFATGLGSVSSRRWGNSRQTPQGADVFDDRATLTAARIDGVTYGVFVVSGEAAPDEAPTLALTAFPNPSAEAFQIGVSGAVGRVETDVFDALGRRVDGGTMSASVPFAFRPEAPGVYVVRARDEAGHTAVRRVIRR